MASRRLEDLHPVTREKTEKFLKRAKEQGIDVLIYCTYRSPEEQEVLYAQGRSLCENIEPNADVQFYANQNDTEAQGLLSWYQAYDDSIWNWVDAELPNYQTVDELLALDMKSIEEQIYQNSISVSPLP